MSNTYRVQVLTKTFVPQLGHDYSDAQYLDVPSTMSLEDVKVAYEAQIQAEEASRIAQRVYEKENPPVVKEPSKEELESMKLEILSQVEAQIADIDAKIAEKGK